MDLEETVLFKFSRKARTKKIINLGCFIKPGEPEEDETALRAGLLITGTIYHSQSRQ